MKRNSSGPFLPLLMLLPGIAALLLRKNLYAVAVDAKGLLLRNHPLEIALTGLTAAVLLLMALFVRRTEKRSCFEDCYAASLIAAFGNVAAAVGIAMTVLPTGACMGSYLERAWWILGLAAPVCLALIAIARVLGKRPFFLLHVVVCLFFVLHIVSHYQLWSGDPQLQNYVFSLLGAMALMFFGFYAAAMEADCGHSRMTIAVGLAAIYLCTAELGRTSAPWLYSSGILWALTDLVSMRKLTVDEQK